MEAGRGLDEGQVAKRRARFGPNRLREAEREPVWRALLRPFQDLLVVVLLIAAAVSALVSREWETPAAILAVVVFNAMINFVQERKAEASLQALRGMTVATATVRRGGAVLEVAAEDLVPGDVVLLEAGSSVPADGRLLEEAALEAQEAALTGESQPVSKSADVVDDSDAALADRTNMVFMNPGDPLTWPQWLAAAVGSTVLWWRSCARRSYAAAGGPALSPGTGGRQPRTRLAATPPSTP